VEDELRSGGMINSQIGEEILFKIIGLRHVGIF
jgi:hypothetical protein